MSIDGEGRSMWRSALRLAGYFLLLALLAWLLAPASPDFGTGGTGRGGSGVGGGADSGSGTGSALSGDGDGGGGVTAGAGDGAPGESASPPEPVPESGAGGGAPGVPAAPAAQPARELDVERIARSTPAPGGGTPGGVAGAGGGGFFGVAVKTGENVIFLIDASGSMAVQTPERRSRIDVVKSELARAVQSSARAAAGSGASFGKRGGGLFAVAVFADGVKQFPEHGMLRFAEAESRAKLAGFLDTLQPGGSTNMLAAWKRLLHEVADSKVDTVYFLSDGDPTDCDAATLLAELEKAPGKLRIHAFSIGQESELLRSVAAKHGGIYRLLM